MHTVKDVRAQGTCFLLLSSVVLVLGGVLQVPITGKMQEVEGQDLTDGEGLDDEVPTRSGYVTNYYETDGDAESDYFSGDGGLDDLEYCDDAFAPEVTGKVDNPRLSG